MRQVVGYILLRLRILLEKGYLDYFQVNLSYAKTQMFSVHFKLISSWHGRSLLGLNLLTITSRHDNKVDLSAGASQDIFTYLQLSQITNQNSPFVIANAHITVQLAKLNQLKKLAEEIDIVVFTNKTSCINIVSTKRINQNRICRSPNKFNLTITCIYKLHEASSKAYCFAKT